MEPQAYEWTCSVCSTAWVLQSIGIIAPDIDQYTVREQVANETGIPHCVNPTYGSMSPQCIIDEFARYGLDAQQYWCTFDQAYAICSQTTGVINPVGMYHYMAVRGVDGHDTPTIWVANSAPGYRGIWDDLTRDSFNSLGPVNLIYLVP
jgi:hypothetical protein